MEFMSCGQRGLCDEVQRFLFLVIPKAYEKCFN